VYAIFAESAEAELLNVGRANVQMSLAALFEVHEQRSPVAEFLLVSHDDIFANFVAPRLGPVTDREPVPPLKFAQLVGFLFAVVGAAGFAFGLPSLGLTATAFALVAAFLNAAFGICLGCQLYPLVTRFRRTPSPA